MLDSKQAEIKDIEQTIERTEVNEMLREKNELDTETKWMTEKEGSYLEFQLDQLSKTSTGVTTGA